MEMVEEGGKKKISFCPFCQYAGSYNISYLNHIIIAHYNMSFGCGKCLKLVFKSGQQLKVHKKVCKGSKKKPADKLVEKPALSGVTTINPSSTLKNKKSATTSTLLDSKMSSQMLQNSQTGQTMSPHCHPCDKEKVMVVTSKKPCSSGKDAKEKHDKHSSKDEEMNKSKHHKNKK